MEKQIKALYEIIKDYRKDNELGISEQRITTWINQFSEGDRIFILTELAYTFGMIYF